MDKHFIMRSAHTAGYRLCMKTTISYLIVSGPAFRTHFKWLHSRFCPVIRKIIYNCKAGTAIGAINKSIIETVSRFVHILQALLADGYIGTDFCDLLRNIVAFFNDEVRESF